MHMISMTYIKWLVISYPRRRKVNPGIMLRWLVRRYSAKRMNDSQSIHVNRFLAANSYPGSNLGNQGHLPEIEVLIPAAAKDLEISKLTVMTVIATSTNPIVSITVVVPRRDVQAFKEIFSDLELSTLKIVCEEEIVGTDLLATIKKEYLGRAGWVLAEFIKYIFVSNSTASGVLIVDADTVLTEKRVWLSRELTQNIFPVFEYHEHYFDFLEFIGVPLCGKEHSYMSHYMLFQPDIYRDMLMHFRSSTPEETLQLLINFPSQNPHSPVCFCYEAYAHFAKYHYPERVIDSKWSNVQVPRNEFIKKQEKYLKAGNKYFSSISTHTYLS